MMVMMILMIIITVKDENNNVDVVILIIQFVANISKFVNVRLIFGLNEYMRLFQRIIT